MKFCPYHHAYLDHGSDVTCLTDVSHLVLLFVELFLFARLLFLSARLLFLFACRYSIF